jgi:transcriptional regulator with XRE-family HTH domain
LTQIELAKALAVSQANIAFWEWSATPPRSDVLLNMARIFGVTVEELVSTNVTPLPKHSGPIGEVQKVFEEVRRLPRRQQRKILETVTALVEQYRRKAS